MTPSLPPVHRIAVLISGRGSNLGSLLDAQAEGRFHPAQIVLVVANNPDAGGLTLASRAGVKSVVVDPTQYETREASDQAIHDALTAYEIDLVALAGYNRILTPVLTTPWAGRMLNIHPSLLPKFGGKGMVGLRVHEAVVAAGETESGCTVHWVTAGVDEGDALGQHRVPVLPDDTPDALARRVLAQEHLLYPEVVARLVAESHAAVSSSPLS
jgi:phosphoribosylglycinamide formyltransferase 1